MNPWTWAKQMLGPKPLMRVKYVRHEWDVCRALAGGFVLRIVDAPPHLKRRTLLVNGDGVTECSRDGKAKPIALMDASLALLVEIEATLEK